jgi:hypothetical protein
MRMISVSTSAQRSPMITKSWELARSFHQIYHHLEIPFLSPKETVWSDISARLVERILATEYISPVAGRFHVPTYKQTRSMEPASYVVVAAKLAAQRSAYWTSFYGHTIAEQLITKPFIAIRLWEDGVWGRHSQEVPKADDFRTPLLFIVSPVKPHGVYENCYFTLVKTPPSSPREIQLSPYPDAVGDGTLFLHTCPSLREVEIENNSMEATPHASTYQIGQDNIEQIRNVIRDDAKMSQARAEGIFERTSGGEDAVGDRWSSWSGQSAKEHETDPYFRNFDFVPLLDEYWRAVPSIHKELCLLRQ